MVGVAKKILKKAKGSKQDPLTDDKPPQMKILNMVISILMHFLTFIRQMHSILNKT